MSRIFKYGLLGSGLVAVLLVTLVSCGHVAPIKERGSVTRGLVLSLDAVESVVAVGTVPRFRLTLSNVSDLAIRILDAERRVDLQHTYYHLVVTKDGRPVD